MNANSAHGFLVWIEGMRGPEAQIWADNDRTYYGQSRPRILAEHPLSEAEMRMSISELKQTYPAPVIEQPKAEKIDLRGGCRGYHRLPPAEKKHG
ncbi:MAG TPA: hypothetical protein VKT73_12780 [Xanthobacteraceae bacterium]|nr:hypothetical protein [Xanthobacteraceae bacterium]